MEKQYEIRAAVYHVSLKLGENRFYTYPIKMGHHFWVLMKREEGKEPYIVEAIHGLAVRRVLDQAGAQRASIASLLGTWNCSLEAYCIENPAQRDNAVLSSWTLPYEKDYWMEPHDTFVLPYNTQDAESILGLWNDVKGFINLLNNAKQSYSFGGLGISLGRRAYNSNSVYGAIAQHLGCEPPRFENYHAPGLNTPLLTPAMNRYSETTVVTPRIAIEMPTP